MQPNTANAGSCRLSNHAKSSAPTSIAKTHLWSRRNQRADGGVLEISALKTNHPGKTGCSTCRESAVGLTEQSPVTTGTWLLLGNNTGPMWGSTSSWHLPAPWESASPIPAPRDAQWGEGEQHRGQAEDRGVMQCAQPQGLAGYRRVDGRTGRKLQGMEERWTDRRTDSRWFSDVSPPSLSLVVPQQGAGWTSCLRTLGHCRDAAHPLAWCWRDGSRRLGPRQCLYSQMGTQLLPHPCSCQRCGANTGVGSPRAPGE